MDSVVKLSQVFRTGGDRNLVRTAALFSGLELRSLYHTLIYLYSYIQLYTSPVQDLHMGSCLLQHQLMKIL